MNIDMQLDHKVDFETIPKGECFFGDEDDIYLKLSQVFISNVHIDYNAVRLVDASLVRFHADQKVSQVNATVVIRQRSLEMPTSEAITGAYIVKGALSNERFPEAVKAFGQGELEFISYLMDVGELVESVYKMLPNPDEVMFVWDYELSEPLGYFIVSHIAVNDITPSPTHLRSQIKERLSSLDEPIEFYRIVGKFTHGNDIKLAAAPSSTEFWSLEERNLEDGTWNVAVDYYTVDAMHIAEKHYETQAQYLGA